MTQESALNCRPYSVNSVYIATRRAQTVSITYFHTLSQNSRVSTLSSRRKLVRDDAPAWIKLFAFSSTRDGANKSQPFHFNLKTS